MNLVVFASDGKGLSSLNGIIKEANNRNINLFAVICQDTNLRFPIQNKDRFTIQTNCSATNPVYCQALGVELPFKPDWLIINRERWEPETSIIFEFIFKFNSKIGLVEPNSYMLNNAESRLENYSKNRFKDLIDVYFVHSSHSKKQQELSGFTGNMVVTGNPKYDDNLNQSPDVLHKLKKIYNVDPNKKQVLLFSLINQHRSCINKIFKDVINSNPQNQYFYKPYPGEPFESAYKDDYYPNFFLENCTPILQESHIWGMFKICNKHIGCLSSIVHASLLSGVDYQDVSLELCLDQKYLDFSGVFLDKGIGIENNKSMWMKSFSFTEESQLKNLLPEKYKEEITESNNEVWKNLNKPKELLKLFDEFNDGNASFRVINYISNDL